MHFLGRMGHVKEHTNHPFWNDSLSLTLSVYVIHKNVSMSPFFFIFPPPPLYHPFLHLSTSAPVGIGKRCSSLSSMTSALSWPQGSEPPRPLNCMPIESTFNIPIPPSSMYHDFVVAESCQMQQLIIRLAFF